MGRIRALKNKISNTNISFTSLLKKGDDVAYETLFRLYYSKLFHIAKSYLLYKEDAEEVVQDVFLKLWEQKRKFKAIPNINGYVFTMTKNMCLDKLKHEKVKRRYIENDLKVKADIQYQFMLDETASSLLESELEQKIIQSINLLPEKCKQVFIKSRMEGLKHKEIAEELGISHRTVENHISLAIKHMKLHLNDFLTVFL